MMNLGTFKYIFINLKIQSFLILNHQAQTIKLDTFTYQKKENVTRLKQTLQSKPQKIFKILI